MKQPYKLFSVSIILIILFSGTAANAQSGSYDQLAILKAAQQEMNNHSPHFISNWIGNYRHRDVSIEHFPYMNGKEKVFQSTTVLPNGWIMKEMLIQQWFNDSWVNFMKYIFTYNTNNKMTEQLLMNWSGNSWVNSMKNTFAYDGNGNTIKMVEQEWASTDWQDVRKDTVIYDITGRASEQITQNWISDAWVNSQKKLMTYDTIMYMMEVLQQNWVSNAWADTLKDSYTMDSSGHALDWIRQNWVGGVWNYISYYTFTYNQNGSITEQLEKIWEHTDWVNAWRQTYTYDTNGYLIQITGEQWLGTTWGSGWIQTNSYDENGNQSETISRFWYLFEWRFTSRITYTWQEITDVKINESGMNGYLLSANYPNPFNPETQIRFTIAKSGFVTLKVYDMLGREITTLVNERKQPGEYSVSWHAQGIPTGVYFYRIIAGDPLLRSGQVFIETRKMVVMQ